MTLLVLFGAALVPMLVGMVWYHKSTFGTPWMKINGFTEEELSQGNMALILGLSYIFSFLIASSLMGMVIHQMGVYQLFSGLPGFGTDGSDSQVAFDALMGEYGDLHRSFLHGVFHGALVGVFFVTPIIAINALFERRSWKYIGIHGGYWIVTLALMGGIVCQWMPL